MRSHEEVELKWALDEAGHAALGARIAARLGPGHALAQRNRFFDAGDGRLRRAGLSVRLRLENGRLVLTCKRKAGDRPPDGGLFRHDEWERELDAAWWPRALAGEPGLAEALDLPAPHREALAGAPLVGLGGFDNQRLEWRDANELVCLDRTAFADAVDHELEVETADPAASAARWRAEMDAAGAAWRPQTTTKFARFLERSRAAR